MPSDPKQTAKRLPIVPSTVEINGHAFAPRNTIWAGMRWSDGIIRRHSLVRDDPHLSVPFCHHNDDMPSHDCGWYRVRPHPSLGENWRFVRARNGAWMLEAINV